VSVAAEVLVFLLVGPPLLARIGPAAGVAVAACAGGVRWALLGSTTAIPWLAAAESLHGLSFALLHLACLALIEESTPERDALREERDLWRARTEALAQPLFQSQRR
ncbi:MFS transporter, partial [Methylobacterium radiotolerans]|uniref:MFS transporter n=1 Tax=Methylobacterium radiotolerans TaxID=31998 RepID=UPI002F34F9AD